MNNQATLVNQLSLNERTYLTHPINNDNLLTSNDLNAAETLKAIEGLVRTIIENKDECFYSVNDCGNGTSQIYQSALFSWIVQTLSAFNWQTKNHFPIYQYNSYVDVFVKNVGRGNLLEKVKLLNVMNTQEGYYHDEQSLGLFRDMAEGIIAFVNTIRHEARSQDFKNIVYNAQQLFEKNCNGLGMFIDSLFNQYSRLLVIRVDFGYHSGNVIRSESDIISKYLEAKEDRKHFFNNVKSNNSLFEHLVGYVWKLEYGIDKGYHYHMLFFFDGSKVRQDETIAMLIGEYWENTITNGRGIYYNCNANKDQYEHLGIGLINHNDIVLRGNLKQWVATYLIKTDHYAKMLVPDNGRTFGRSEILKPNENRLGRPREYV
jgi:Inovirus Gp2